MFNLKLIVMKKHVKVLFATLVVFALSFTVNAIDGKAQCSSCEEWRCVSVGENAQGNCAFVPGTACVWCQCFYIGGNCEEN